MPQHGHIGKGVAAVQRVPVGFGHGIDPRAALIRISRCAAHAFAQITHARQGVQQHRGAALVHAAFPRQVPGVHPVAVAQNNSEKIQFSRRRQRAGALVARGVALQYGKGGSVHARPPWLARPGQKE